MKIIILANNLDFFKKFGNNKNCINFIKDSDIFVRIRDRSDNLFGNIFETIVVSQKDIPIEKYKKKYNNILYNCPTLFLSKKFIENNPKFYNNKKNKEEITKKKYSKDIEFLKINDIYFNKYNHLFSDSTILNGHKIILHYLSKYPNSKIYLLGFNYNDKFIRDERYNTEDIAKCHSLEQNKIFLNMLLDEYKNIVIKNSF